MKLFKGFDKDMKCRGFQFTEGNVYHEDAAKLCNTGFHACENPLDCLNYYCPGEGSIYREVELEDVTGEHGEDTKRVGKTIRIGAALDVAGICKAHFEYVKERTTNNKQVNDNANLTAQDRSSLAARNGSSLAAMSVSSLAAQDRSSLAAGKNSVLAAFNSKAKAGIGSIIAIANRVYQDGEWRITDFACGVVDGKTIMPNTWYEVKNGKFVEVKE